MNRWTALLILAAVAGAAVALLARKPAGTAPGRTSAIVFMSSDGTTMTVHEFTTFNAPVRERVALPPERRAGSAELVAALDGMGFFKHVPAADAAKAKSEAGEFGLWMGGDYGRLFFADSEDLAEGYAVEFVHEIWPYLEREKVTTRTLDYAPSEAERDGLALVVDGTTVTLFTHEEVERDGDVWQLTATRLFGTVNRWLEDAGSAERIHQLYGGNDTTAVFLTPPMYDAIRASAALDAEDKPQAPAVTRR